MESVIVDEGPVGVEFEGKTYVAWGSLVTEDSCIGYLGDDHALTSAAGEVIGHYRITSRWPTPRSWLSSSMCQVIATVQGRHYTGRSGGSGMLFRGRRIAALPHCRRAKAVALCMTTTRAFGDVMGSKI